MITDDIESARNAMRPMIALYVGGMGSREQNFYNRLISSYGFEREARQVQDLYLEGRRVEAMEALPDEMIDMVSIVGPPPRRKRRSASFATPASTRWSWPAWPSTPPSASNRCDSWQSWRRR